MDGWMVCLCVCVKVKRCSPLTDFCQAHFSIRNIINSINNIVSFLPQSFRMESFPRFLAMLYLMECWRASSEAKVNKIEGKNRVFGVLRTRRMFIMVFFFDFPHSRADKVYFRHKMVRQMFHFVATKVATSKMDYSTLFTDLWSDFSVSFFLIWSEQKHSAKPKFLIKIPKVQVHSVKHY